MCFEKKRLPVINSHGSKVERPSCSNFLEVYEFSFPKQEKYLQTQYLKIFHGVVNYFVKKASCPNIFDMRSIDVQFIKYVSYLMEFLDLEYCREVMSCYKAVFMQNHHGTGPA